MHPSDPPPRRPEHWVVLGAALAVVIAYVGLGLFLEPDPRGYGTHERFGFRPCFPMEAWNVPCPGCGVTTAVTQAAHLDLVGSLATQPFGLFLALAGVAFVFWALLGHLRGKDLWSEAQKPNWRRWGTVAGILMAAAWIYKLAAVRGWFG